MFNGERYNFLKLREEIENELGTDFNTNSDTEVLYLGIKYFGKDFLARVNGIFALIYYDIKTQKLLAACDEFAVKPLYFF